MTVEEDMARSQRRIQDLKRRMFELKESSMNSQEQRRSIANEHAALMNEYLREYSKLIGYRVEYHDKKAFCFRLAAIAVFCVSIVGVMIMMVGVQY